MYIKLTPDDPRPQYQQVIDEIKALIARGDLPEGTILPSVRQVAADLGVNLNTIAAAYRALQDEGLLDVRHGRGAVVRSRTTTTHNEGQLRTPLRTALTQLVLAGMPRAEIMRLVSDELAGLFKRVKS
jgi:GntR family transcriptional regulator